MKNIVDKLLGDILTSTGYERRTLNVFCKDGFCLPVDLINTKVEATETALVLIGKIVEINEKKGIKKLKQDVVIPWSEISRLDFLRETA